MTKANKQIETKVQAQTQATSDEIIKELVTKLIESNELMSTRDVTGYTGVYYANETLVELHFKKRSISHATFGSSQVVFEYLKANKLITRVVPKSYGWKLDTECLMTKDFTEHFLIIMEQLIKASVEKRNLKNKKDDKKVANK